MGYEVVYLAAFAVGAYVGGRAMLWWLIRKEMRTAHCAKQVDTSSSGGASIASVVE